nr:ankyrin repeat-containing protein At5g02620-like [Coffea arabica]
MKLILEKLPDLIKDVDKFGWTALHYAAKFNHQEIARLLLSADRFTAYVAAKNDDSKTALHIAVIHGHVVLVQEILSHCPDCWVQIAGKSQNILHLAVKHEKGEVLEFVLPNSWASGSLTKRIMMETALSTYELEQAGGTRGYQNVATVKNIQASKADEVERVERLAGHYLIVATQIATVTFAAGFTVPGGYYSDGPHKGMAVLGKKAAFITFVISDSLAMIASIGAVLEHLKLVQSKNYRFKLFVVRRIRMTMFQPVILMIMAFLTGLYAVLQNFAVMIVPCVLSAWLSVDICWTFCRRREVRERAYTAGFKDSEADHFAFIGPFILPLDLTKPRTLLC